MAGEIAVELRSTGQPGAAVPTGSVAIDLASAVGQPLAQLLKRPEITIEQLAAVLRDLMPRFFERDSSSEIRNELKSVETEIKYAGYLEQQQRAIERLKKAEQRRIPDWFDYSSVSGLSREMQDGAVGHEAVDYRSGRTEKLQLNIVVACPAIKKRKHSQAPAADRLHGRKIQRNDAGLGLRSHNIAKLENRFATDDPALTFHNCEVAHVLDINGQHEILPLFIAKAIAVPKRLPYFSA